MVAADVKIAVAATWRLIALEVVAGPVTFHAFMSRTLMLYVSVPAAPKAIAMSSTDTLTGEEEVLATRTARLTHADFVRGLALGFPAMERTVGTGDISFLIAEIDCLMFLTD